MSNSAQRATPSDRPESFQLKGGLYPMNLLELKSIDLEQIKQELTAKVRQAPAFFQHSPLVLGVEQLADADQTALDLEALCHACRALQLVPAATRGGNAHVQSESLRLGLALLPKGRNRPADKPDGAEESEREPQSTETLTASGISKIVTSPVRSGQQIYARGGDLVVMAAVSAGAEVLADGHIHIYGPLRGRALAGVQGDERARIFCTSQEAELVSIAGHFMVDEVLRDNHWKAAATIYMRDGRIHISPLPIST